MFSLEQYTAVRRASGMLDRSARTRLRLAGADRRDYLQGLLTNDIAALAPGAGCYAALLTAQGRMIADMYVMETGAEVLMDVEPEIGDKVAAHLARFIFSEDVQIANVTPTLAQISVIGPASAAVVGEVLGSDALSASMLESMAILENRSVRWREADMLVARRDDLGVAGFDLFFDRALADRLSAALLAAGTIAIDPEVAETVRVERGRPRFGRDMNEDTIPLEAGIEAIAISMTKGCYVGQEIIIRVLHRGQGRVARRLVGLVVEGGADVPAPQHGDRIRSGEREIGSVTSAVWSPQAGAAIALGYVHRDFVEPGTIVSIDRDGVVLRAAVSRLPLAAGADAGEPHSSVPR